jgi:hypothetical protein
LFFSPPPQMCTQSQMTVSPIHNSQNWIWNYFLQKWLWHSSYTKIHVILSKCDDVIENIQIHMWWKIYFIFFNFAEMWKINMKRKYLILFEKKSLNLHKTKNHVATFSYWFCFSNNFLKSLDRFLEHHLMWDPFWVPHD